MRSLIAIILLVLSQSIYASNEIQVVRGQVKDAILQRPISGATVLLIELNKGAITDSNGEFRIESIPVGTFSLKVSAMGFNDATMTALQVISGKEAVLAFSLDEKLILKKEVVVKGKGLRSKPMNEMSVVSARAFTVEETQKYAASVNDPARMATNFAGVASADDGNNQIVIRGNSPAGMLWRMEGIEIPNPNHFASVGSSGGGISILSAQLLDNSDFITGAFSPEYGNALSGVFDLSMRKGNNEKKEYTAQVGLLGLNLAAEGPFSKKSKASYLINYRYSTLSILAKLGLSFTPSVTNFQDLSFHVFIPSNKLGTFSIFSLGGLSNQYFNAKKDSSKWKESYERYSDEFVSNTGMWGISHKIDIGKKSYLKTILGYSIVESKYERSYTKSDYTDLPMYKQSYKQSKLTLSSQYNRKISTRITMRSGLIACIPMFRYTESFRENLQSSMNEYLATSNHTQVLQSYTNFQFKVNNQVTALGGFHGVFLALNNTYSIEPRLSVRWLPSTKQTIGFGYGNHSQVLPLGVYFYKENGAMPNEHLKFSKAHHFVASHQYHFSKFLKLKTEVYYQSLYKIPVSIYDSSTFSMLNVQSDYVRESLQNKGNGANYGIEVSLEKLLARNFYYMVALSLYESKYKTAQSAWYDTRFNGKHLLNIVAGKDFNSNSKKRTFGIHIKNVYAGGYRSTPIDLATSIAQSKAVYKQEKAYSEKLPNYFRLDLRLLMKWNAKRITHTLSLDVQNVTNTQNVYDRYYDTESATLKTYYQMGFVPILNYKVEF